MKILSWIQSKFKGRHESKESSCRFSATHHMLQEPHKEEFSERHHALLAIGTFGKNNLEEDPERSNLDGKSSSSHIGHLQDLTTDELEKLQDQLDLLFHKQDESTNCSAELEATSLRLMDKLLDLESSLELGGGVNSKPSDECNGKDGSLHGSISMDLNRAGKDVSLQNNKGAVGKKSLSLLLKKIFVGRRGIAARPAASGFRDPLPESRMEKILRAILYKKIYPQSSSTASLVKRYLDNRDTPNSDDEDELNLRADDGSKWVKTDSEYIVLEI